MFIYIYIYCFRVISKFFIFIKSLPPFRTFISRHIKIAQYVCRVCILLLHLLHMLSFQFKTFCQTICTSNISHFLNENFANNAKNKCRLRFI